MVAFPAGNSPGAFTICRQGHRWRAVELRAVPCWNKAAAEATTSEEESGCLRFGVRNAPRHIRSFSLLSSLNWCDRVSFAVNLVSLACSVVAKGVRGGTGRRHLLFANRPEMDWEMDGVTIRHFLRSDVVFVLLLLKPRTNNSQSLVLV